MNRQSDNGPGSKTIPIGQAVEIDSALPIGRSKIVRIGQAIEKDTAFPTKVTHVGTLLVQTVIIPGAKTDEGQLVEAVAEPWFEILALLESDPLLMFQIGPRKWEEVVAGAYHRAGFDQVTLTPRSRDLGRDVIAVTYGLGTVRVIDQVKAFGPNHLVTADDVRALLGVLQGDKASKGFLTTTSDFAPKLPDDILLQPFIPRQLELINGKMLLARLKELAKKKA